MSDHIPFEIQMEIIKKVHDVKSLIKFRFVTKPWKFFIDSSHFINEYGDHHTEPQSLILTYYVNYSSEAKFICLVDDDIETFKVLKQEHAPFVMSPLLEQYCVTSIIGTCHGLVCLHGFLKGYKNWMVVIWNASIGKSFGIDVPGPNYDPKVHIWNEYGFGVSPLTRDPTVVKFGCEYNMPWYIEVFTMSSGVWNLIPGGNLPRQSIKLYFPTQAVIDRFIYWGAREKTYTDDGESTINHMVVSFDLITKDFKVVDLPDNLTNELGGPVYISKLRESLVVYGSMDFVGPRSCGVWVMDHDSSFRKIFSIGARVGKILGFSKSGETIFETRKVGVWLTTLDVYDPCSQKIKNLEVSGVGCSFFMGSYKESLLLLDQLDSRIYYDTN